MSPPPDVDFDADPRDAAQIDAPTDGIPAPDAAIDGPPGTYHVGGNVSGMWDGGAVALRLQGPGVDDLESVTSNTGFNFDMVLEDGASYTVTVETQPDAHVCSVVGGTGAISGADVNSIDVDCVGPAVSVALSAPYPFVFDPSDELQELDASVITQEITVTVTSPQATAITVDGNTTTSGTPSAWLPLGPGASDVPVVVTAGTVSRTWTLRVNRGVTVPIQTGYVKASNTGAGDDFGTAVAADGDLFVIGAPLEDSNTSGINVPSNESASESGAVYVFRRDGLVWSQEAFIKASNTGADDRFGAAVAISGNTLVIGAPQEDGASNNVSEAGAAYVFVRTGGLWSQQAVLRSPAPMAADYFGSAVSIQGDVVAVGAPSTSGATNSAGVAHAFRRSGTTWSHEPVPTGSVTAQSASAGTSIAVDDSLLAVSSPNAEGTGAGVVLVYRYQGGAWSEEAVLRALSSGVDFGRAVVARGDTVAVGAHSDPSNARGVNAPAGTPTAAQSGAVYVFRRTSGLWAQEAFIKSSNSDPLDFFGWALSLRGDLLLACALFEAGGIPGVDPSQGDNTQSAAGAAYLFQRTGTTWNQLHYLKSSNPESSDLCRSASLGADVLLLGSPGEDSSATGINGGQASNAASQSGAAYSFR